MNSVIGFLLMVATTTIPPAIKTPTAGVDKVPVFLHTEAQDVVGSTYVARLREALKGSTAYRPVMHPADAQFVVTIVTLDPKEVELGSRAGQFTVAAVTLQREQPMGPNQFVYSWVLVARRDKVDTLATELWTAIDKEIQGLDAAAVRLFGDVPAATK